MKRATLLDARPALAAVASLSVSADDSLADRLAARVRFFDGTVSLYAKNLETGREVGPRGRPAGADGEHHQAADPLRARSRSSRPAPSRWDEPLTVRRDDKVSGSGMLADFEDGSTVSVRNAATLMIVVSDNTATNLVLDRITADAVNGFLDTLGLHETRALRKVRGDGATLRPPSGWSKAGLARRQPALRPRRVDAARDGAPARACCTAGQVVSPASLEGRARHPRAPAAQGRHRPPRAGRRARGEQERVARRAQERRRHRLHRGRSGGDGHHGRRHAADRLLRPTTRAIASSPTSRGSSPPNSDVRLYTLNNLFARR